MIFHKALAKIRKLRIFLFTQIFLSIFALGSAAAIDIRADSPGHLPDGRFDSGRIVRYSAIIGGGALVFALDGDFRDIYQKPGLHGRSADRIFDQVENLGKETPYLFIAPAFLGYGLIAKNNRSFTTGEELAAGLLTSYAITGGIKAAFGRKRPYESDSPYDFFDGGRSFYSGHTVTAFTAAAIISSNYPKQNLGFMGIDRDLPIVPVLLYSAAGLVGIQRLYANAHWSSDVYVGALAGYGLGKLTFHIGNKITIGYLAAVTGKGQFLTILFEFPY